MQELLGSLTSTLSTDPVLAGIVVAWAALHAWGVAVLVLAYCSRMRERAAMVNPPRHPLFPSSRRTE